MLAQILKIEEISTINVTFYTIKFEGKSVSEITDFYDRMESDDSNYEELNIIDATINEIGQKSALDRYFSRKEQDAYALPTYSDLHLGNSENDFGIRLYCVVLSYEIVFLLNGDRKKTQSAQNEKSNVSRFFYMANSLFKELINNKLSGLINWNESGQLIYESDYLVNIK